MTESLTTVPWSAGTWTTPPAAAVATEEGLRVTAIEGSDAWRRTAYGFVHDDAHALLAPLPPGAALEVTFVADLAGQFDQAGAMLRVDAETWVKAGVELADGTPQVGAVVTRGRSDWSVRPVPGWAGRPVTVRLSRGDDAVTVRARVADEPFGLVRVAPFPAGASAGAGPYCCAPTRPGLEILFTAWCTGPADAALH